MEVHPVSESTKTDRAGWSIPSYCEACNFSRATFYNLPDDRRPRSLKIGKRHIVIEPPAEFLARLAAEQEAVQ
jgi:predicted DNA-binding transcriptional regulator AlpA